MSENNIASSREVANYLRRDCRALRDSLQLEMVIAQYDLQLRSVESPEGIPVGDAAAAGVVAELERKSDALSHAILRGLAYLSTGETARRSADAAARLSEHGVGLTAKFADVADARPVEAWREGCVDGDEYCLFIDFEFPLGARHAIALFVEPRHGGVVKHIGLLSPMSELEEDAPFHPGALESVPIRTAGELLAKVLARTAGPRGELLDDYRMVIAAARARSMQQDARPLPAPAA
jgi:hypothetical protein